MAIAGPVLGYRHETGVLRFSRIPFAAPPIGKLRFQAPPSLDNAKRPVIVWLHGGIEQFGGDPNNVSLMGESAGDYLTASLLLLPEHQPLFHKAILQIARRHVPLWYLVKPQTLMMIL